VKILHVLDHSLPLHSGYTFRSQSIFHAQQKRGWHPVVVTSPKHEQNLGESVPDCEEINGITYHRCGATPEVAVPFITEAWLMHVLSRRILAVAKAEKPDVLHAHSPALNAIPTLWAGKKLGLPVVYEIRAFWEDAAVDHGTYAEGSWKYRLTKTIETWACKKVDHIGILCNGLKDDLISRGIPTDKITPVFNGINPENFKPTLPNVELCESWGLEGKKVVGFIGSFYRYEGLDLLVRAFAKVAKEQTDVVLLLVGGGEVEIELRAQISKLGLEDRVVMPGRIPHERIPGVYALIDVLVYPRHAMRLTDLVTPLKPLEAMAMGKVLIASDVGGHLELIRHNETGLLFPAGDSEALAATITTTVNSPILRKRMIQQASDWVIEKHRWEVTTSVYEDIYRSALNNRPGNTQNGEDCWLQ